MTHLFAANSCGREDIPHYQLILFPQPAPRFLASAGKPGAGGKGSPVGQQHPGAGGNLAGTRSPGEAAASTKGREGGDKVCTSRPGMAMDQLLSFLKDSWGRCFSKQIGFLLKCLQSEKYKARQK